MDGLQLLAAESNLLQARQMFSETRAERIIAPEDDLSCTHNCLETLHLDDIGRLRCVVIESPQMVQLRVRLRWFGEDIVNDVRTADSEAFD